MITRHPQKPLLQRPRCSSCHSYRWGFCSLATEELDILHQLQLMKLQIGYAGVLSQEQETLHPTQPALTATVRWKSSPSDASLKRGRGNCVFRYIGISAKLLECKTQENIMSPKEYIVFQHLSPPKWKSVCYLKNNSK